MGIMSYVLGYVLGYLEKNKELKQKLVDKLNAHVDIPMINEETEEKVFNALFEVVKDTLVVAAM